MGEASESALATPAVAGPLDLGHDLEPQLLPGRPALPYGRSGTAFAGDSPDIAAELKGGAFGTRKILP